MRTRTRDNINGPYVGLDPKEKSALWRERNKERNLAHQKAYKEKNREKIAESNKEYYARVKEHRRDRARLKKYGLTREDFLGLLCLQNNLCALCLSVLPEDHSKIAVDHNHETGCVRGLLHFGCNVAVGAYENYKEELKRYLGEDN